MPGQAAIPEWLSDTLSAYPPVLLDLIGFFVGIVIVYLIGRVVFIPGVTHVVRSRNRNNPTIVSATKKYGQILLLMVGIFTGIILAGYGWVLSETAVIIAAITVILGIAGQQVFGSFISGMFLVADPDFNVGDWIEWPEGRGTIEAVDFRVTRIRTPNNETLTVPNTQLTNNTITRPYGRNSYRITEQVYVAYYEDTERALKELQQIASNQETVITDPAPTARIVELGANSITIQTEFWIEDPVDRDIRTVRSDFRRIVKRQFDEEGITLAPPAEQLLSGDVVIRNAMAESPASDSE